MEAKILPDGSVLSRVWSPHLTAALEDWQALAELVGRDGRTASPTLRAMLAGARSRFLDVLSREMSD